MASPKSALIVVDMQNDFCPPVWKVYKDRVLVAADTDRMALSLLKEQETQSL